MSLRDADATRGQATAGLFDRMRRGWIYVASARRVIPMLLCFCTLSLTGCQRAKPIIYVIPRTTATLFWENVHSGALAAGQQRGYRIYWNAATRDDDVGRQIALLNRAESRRPAGIIVAPVHAAALLTAVRGLLREHLPVVIIGSRLPLPAGPDLMYIVPDHEGAGRGIADKILQLEHSPRVVLVGLNPDIMANVEVVRGIRLGLEVSPAARVIALRFSRFNRQQTEEQVESLLSSDAEVNTVVSLDADATAGTLDALRRSGLGRRIHVIGRDQDMSFQQPLASGDIAALLEEDTYTEGSLAVQAIAEHRQTGHWPVPPVVHTHLITAADLNEPAVRKSFTMFPER